MNRILKICRYVLFIIALVLFILFIVNNGEEIDTRLSFIINNILLIVLTILFIKDVIKKEKINNNRIYNTIGILTFLTIILLLGRTEFDKSLIYNDKKTINEYIEIYNSYEKDNKIGSNTKILDIDSINLKYYKTNFFSQNYSYLIILEGLIIIFRRINIKEESK